MAKKLNIMGVKSLPVANNGMKLSELISLEQIETVDSSEQLFPYNEKLLRKKQTKKKKPQKIGMLNKFKFQMNLKIAALSERSMAKRSIHCMIPFK